MRITVLSGIFLKAASTLQDIATYVRPRVGVILFSLSAAIIIFMSRYLPKDELE